MSQEDEQKEALDKRVTAFLGLLKMLDKEIDSLNDAWLQMTEEDRVWATPAMQRAQEAIRTFKRN